MDFLLHQLQTATKKKRNEEEKQANKSSYILYTCVGALSIASPYQGRGTVRSQISCRFQGKQFVRVSERFVHHRFALLKTEEKGNVA
jgi:hypothetical protein